MDFRPGLAPSFIGSFLKFPLVLALFIAMTLNVATVRKAQANDAVGAAIAIGILGVAAHCASNPAKCGGRKSGGARGPADAIALNREQAMLIQDGLQNLGFYYGAIDGAIGSGTRNSIRAYQASVYAPQTGVMTGEQINALVAASSRFNSYEPNDPAMFAADIAPDLDRNGVREMQAALNAKGYPAGTVDGAFGGNTRTALITYKARNGLPGDPVPTRRVLAHMRGEAFAPTTTTPVVATKQQALTGEVAATMDEEPDAAPATDEAFEMLGVKPGMTPELFNVVLATAMGNGAEVTRSSGQDFGGGHGAQLAVAVTQPGWPTAPAEKIVGFFAGDDGADGLVAMTRFISVDASVTFDMFNEHIRPGIVENFGDSARMGDSLLWIGKAEERPNPPSVRQAVDNCGLLYVGQVGTGAWDSPDHVKLDAEAMDGMKTDCGHVLSVSFEDSMVRFLMWDSTAISAANRAVETAVVPQIKF